MSSQDRGGLLTALRGANVDQEARRINVDGSGLNAQQRAVLANIQATPGAALNFDEVTGQLTTFSNSLSTGTATVQPSFLNFNNSLTSGASSVSRVRAAFDDLRTSLSRVDFSRLITPLNEGCLLYTSPSPRDRTRSRMPSSA